MKYDNHKAFKKGMEKAKDLILNYLMDKLDSFGKYLLTNAQMNAKFQSFTGNTLTSIAFGLYENNNLIAYSFIEGLKPAIRAKVQNGVFVYLQNPYEGEARGVSGQVAIDEKYGYQTSERILKELRPKGGSGIIMTTGTEYSEFIEERGLNVLTDTFNNAKFEAASWMKINPNASIK